MLNFASSHKLERCRFKGWRVLSFLYKCCAYIFCDPELILPLILHLETQRLTLSMGPTFFPELCNAWQDIIHSKVLDRP